jgi:tellurite resistance protein
LRPRKLTVGVSSKPSGSKSTESANIPKAVLTPAIAAMFSGGDLNHDELFQLHNLVAINSRGIFANLDHDGIGRLIHSIMDEIKEKGAGPATKQAAARLSPRRRQTAYCFVAAVFLADGQIEDDEQKALMAIANLLELQISQATQILEVMSVLLP